MKKKMEWRDGEWVRQRARGRPRERILLRQKEDLRKTDAGRRKRTEERKKARIEKGKMDERVKKL